MLAEESSSAWLVAGRETQNARTPSTPRINNARIPCFPIDALRISFSHGRQQTAAGRTFTPQPMNNVKGRSDGKMPDTNKANIYFR